MRRMFFLLVLIFTTAWGVIAGYPTASCNGLDPVYGKIYPAGSDSNPSNFVLADPSEYGTRWGCYVYPGANCLYYYDPIMDMYYPCPFTGHDKRFVQFP